MSKADSLTIRCGCCRPGIRSFNKMQVMPMDLHVVHEEPGQWLQLPSRLQRDAQTSCTNQCGMSSRPGTPASAGGSVQPGGEDRPGPPRTGEDPRGQARTPEDRPGQDRTPEDRPGQPHTATVTSQMAKPAREGCTVVLQAPCLPVSSGCLNQCLLSGLWKVLVPFNSEFAQWTPEGSGFV